MKTDKDFVVHQHEVRGILDGSRTTLWRLVKLPRHRFESQVEMHQIIASVNRDGGGNWVAWSPNPMTDEETARIYPFAAGFPCPYGRPGDTIRGKEVWAPEGDAGAAWFKAGIPEFRSGRMVGWLNFPYRLDGVIEPHDGIEWQSAESMPEWASRIHLEVTAVQVKRLRDIANETGLDKRLSRLRAINPWMWGVGFKNLEQRR